ncbi:MAG: mechanosensitive ion channel family protein, partial [Deltaproteobacteria bacterium]|nr:mechanosensitive ion channel family protein [Kofleriaceae bacterium]
MPEWLDRTFLDVEAWKYLAILGVVFGALLGRAILEWLLRRYFRTLLARTGLTYLEKTIEGADRALGFLTFALILFIAVPLIELPEDASKIIKIAARMMTAIGAVWLSFRVLDVLFDWLAGRAEHTDSKLDDQLIPILRRTVKVFAAVIGGLFVLQNMNVDVGSLLAGLGLGGLAFALAAKDTVANFFGSVMIFVDKPFTIGDWVVIDKHEGIVEEVGFRTSRIRTFYDSVLTVPNSMMTTAVIDNYGARKYRRYSTTLGITYGTSPERVQAFCEGIRAIISGMPGMRKDYYLVEFRDFGDFSLNVMLYCFMETPTWADELRVRTRLNLEILRLAEKLGVSFAFPTTSVHIERHVAPGTAPSAPRPPSAAELAELV